MTDTAIPGQESVIDTANSGQESDRASSGVQKPSENTIVNTSSSTVAKRFSVTPAQALAQEDLPSAPQDEQPPPMANASRHSGSDDDHENRQPAPAPEDGGGAAAKRSPGSRSAAFLSDFDAAAAALRASEELPPSKQYVLVDRV